MMKLLFLGLISIILVSQAIAQETYISRQGVLMIKSIKEDSVLNARFNNIIVKLDYDKAELDLMFKLDDSMDGEIPSNRYLFEHDAKIIARLSLPRIETQAHPDWKFHAKGDLIYNELAYYLMGNGVLKHINGSEEVTCTLTMKLEFLEEIQLIIEPFGEVTEMHLYQLVLNKEYLDEREKAGY